MTVCTLCGVDGHTKRSCQYKNSLPPIHTLMGESSLCGIPREVKVEIPTKIMLMEERPLCPACEHKKIMMRSE